MTVGNKATEELLTFHLGKAVGFFSKFKVNFKVFAVISF